MNENGQVIFLDIFDLMINGGSVCLKLCNQRAGSYHWTMAACRRKFSSIWLIRRSTKKTWAKNWMSLKSPPRPRRWNKALLRPQTQAHLPIHHAVGERNATTPTDTESEIPLDCILFMFRPPSGRGPSNLPHARAHTPHTTAPALVRVPMCTQNREK